MSKKYVLKLTAQERDELQQVVKKGRTAAWKVQRAQALLKCVRLICKAKSDPCSGSGEQPNRDPEQIFRNKS